MQFTASYTWSHALDEQSGLGLFFTGNNPLDLKSNYASSDFDQTHVFLINYSYTIPNLTSNNNRGWVSSSTAGQLADRPWRRAASPTAFTTFPGSVASLYFGTSDYIGNPIVPLKPGVTAKQAQLQGTLGVNAGKPVLNAERILPAVCGARYERRAAMRRIGVRYFESLYGTSGRNIFRGPFQVRFDMSLAKEFPIKERFSLRFEFDAFNIFNHPDFDAPNNNVTFFPNFEAPRRSRRRAAWA